MEDKKLLNIIKEYFRENFELVEPNYVSTKPITSTNKQSPKGQHGMFGKISTNHGDDTVHGEISSESLSLDVGKFIFEVKKTSEIKFNGYVSMRDYSENKYSQAFRINGINSQNTETKTYEINIKRKSESSHSRDGVILTKVIEVDEKFYTDIVSSIKYDEERMSEELTELLSDMRNKKIDKLTKEE